MSANQPRSSYAVDIVFCIDCTGSMGPYLESVKQSARSFHTMLAKKMDEKDKGIRQLRIRVVAYRDLGEEGEKAIWSTNFFNMPDEASGFESFVSSLDADGGGDEPESGLEALVTAIRSPWERGLDKRRHVIVVCTDASAHPLGRFTVPTTGQTQPMPADLAGLQSIWGDEVDDGEMEFSSKRLIVFGPDMYPWNELGESLENCIWVTSRAGQGMRDADQETVLEAVAGSV
jgi:von Willebrand factor type A domain